MTLKERVSEVMLGQAQKLDAQRTKKALRRVLPSVEWIYTKATTEIELRLLTSAGWEPVQKSDNHILGISTISTTLMRKRNPNL